MNENAPKILDQDDFVLHPMVWTGSGEIVGNHVTVTIRAYDGVYKCFARVEHAKYLTVDGRACWIGTSNWSRDYFHGSRNVGLVLLGEGATRDPDRFFARGWHGPYTEIVEPCGEYAPPRRR